MFGVADRLGTIAPGRIGNLVIASGDLFTEDAKVLTTWVDGRWFDTETRTIATRAARGRSQRKARRCRSSSRAS
jgi:adenine deaminase